MKQVFVVFRVSTQQVDSVWSTLEHAQTRVSQAPVSSPLYYSMFNVDSLSGT